MAREEWQLAMGNWQLAGEERTPDCTSEAIAYCLLPIATNPRALTHG